MPRPTVSEEANGGNHATSLTTYINLDANGVERERQPKCHPERHVYRRASHRLVTASGVGLDGHPCVWWRTRRKLGH